MDWTVNFAFFAQKQNKKTNVIIYRGMCEIVKVSMDGIQRFCWSDVLFFYGTVTFLSIGYMVAMKVNMVVVGIQR